MPVSELAADSAVAETRAWFPRPVFGLAVPAVLVLLLSFSCFVLPAVSPLAPPVGGDVRDAALPAFSPGHPLGTDLEGNDVLSRLLHGGRASLTIAAAVNAIGLLAGGLIGAVAAYRGGWVDAAAMRVIDILIAFPSLVLLLAMAQALGPSIESTISALSLFSIPAFARVARAAALRLRQEPFIAASELCGIGASAMLLKHIAPNVLPQLIAFGSLGMGVAVILEGALSYLGLGVPPPAPSWGGMIAAGQRALLVEPALVLFPSAALFLTVLAFNLLGEALRERWTPPGI